MILERLAKHHEDLLPLHFPDSATLLLVRWSRHSTVVNLKLVCNILRCNVTVSRLALCITLLFYFIQAPVLYVVVDTVGYL